MTRDRKTLSAVFMAVLLVLASGTAVSLAVTADSTTEADASVVASTTTTVEGTTTAAANGEQASVTINEQQTEGAQVVVESATLPEGGFIAIHDSSVQEAPLASVLGNSVYLEPGTHENVTITLARPIAENQTLVAMPHLDTNDNQVYDFVLSSGEIDGPYTVDGEVVTDAANVTVIEETTTTPAEENTTTPAEENTTTTTTTEEVVEENTTTTTEEVVEETTTTTTEEVVEETTTTTTEEVVEENTTTTTEEEVEETTTTTEEEEEEVETTTPEEEEEEVETTPTEAPAEMEQFVFQIEQMTIDRWVFVIGDEEEADRTQRLGNVTITDRRVTINLTQLLRQSNVSEEDLMQTTTPNAEEVEENLEENLTKDIPTVRFVITNVRIENVTFVITAPEDVELPEPPVTTTTEEVVEETTTTTTEEVVEETTTTTTEETTTTTTEETTTTTTEETTTTPAEETTTTPVEETTTTPVEETTTTPVEETTTTPAEETTTTPAEGTTTTEAVELDSFEVSNLTAPSAVTVGETIEVSATITNPNEQEATQAVAFRLEGTVLARQTVTIGAGETTTVTFEINTSDLPPGQYIHGVYTRNFGELAVIALEEPTAEETTTPAAEETTTTAEEAEQTTTTEA